MQRIGRRWFLAGSASLAGAVLVGCSGDNGGQAASPTSALRPGTGPGATANSILAAPGSPGFVDEAAWQARIDRYLQAATAELDPSNITSINANLVAAHRDPDHPWDPSECTVEALQRRWDQLDQWQDTRDFAFVYFHWTLALADGSTPATTLDPALLEAIKQRMIDNRYRYDDPYPADRVDELWYWSENHLIIGLVAEYLAGQRWPDETFTVTGLTGAEHAERSKQPILDWVHERSRFGFFEWHSHVYMKKNIEPLAALIEFADDPELVQAAAMALDLCILDMAAHDHKGSYTASRGRTYAKDKTNTREGTFDMFKLIFDDTEYDHRGGADAGATHLAGATRYRPPQVLIDIGHLREANSYAWRGDHVSLASVLDYRFGQMHSQIHTWQATIDAEAYVFTTHPMTDLPTAQDWQDDAKPGYWTGEASAPRAAQHERTGIFIYQPAWDETTDDLLWTVFPYRDFTHAFVPQDRFDEVVQDAGWTFARKGDGYIALWSWRPTTWRTYDPAVHPMIDMTQPYDLVAEGGPDNVWIVEVGDRSASGSFEDFVAAITAAEPAVERDDEGFTVAWTSPSSGAVEFGSTAPFTVDGDEQPLGDHPRHESKWGTVEAHATTVELTSDQARIALDFDTNTRTVDAQ